MTTPYLILLPLGSTCFQVPVHYIFHEFLVAGMYGLYYDGYIKNIRSHTSKIVLHEGSERCYETIITTSHPYT